MEGGGKRSEQSVTWTGRRRCGDREAESNRRRKRKENNELRVTSLSRSPLSLAHRPPARPRRCRGDVNTPHARGRREREGRGGGPRGAEAGEHARRRLAHAFRRAPCLRIQEIPGGGGWAWGWAGDWREGRRVRGRCQSQWQSRPGCFYRKPLYACCN